MNRKAKNLNEHLLDAMLEISENDTSESIRMLEESGIDTKLVFSRSLEKIKSMEAALQNKTNESLINTVTKKINDLVALAPAKANNFLNTYFVQNAPTVQFQARSLITPKMISKLGASVDLQDLEKKVDKESDDVKIKKTKG
jgi:3-methyladenine DNA glycosylase AlkC